MAGKPRSPTRAVPWPAWAVLGVLLLALGGVAVWQALEERAQAAAPQVAAAPPPPAAAPAPERTLSPEREKALVQLAALDAARAHGTALADEVSRLRWALLDGRRQCVPAPPPPPQVAEAGPEPPVEEPEPPEPVAEAPEPPTEEPPAEEPAVVVVETETPEPPVEVAAAPPPPEPVVVAETPAPPPQVAAAEPPAAAPLPGCPAPRPPEEAPEVVFVLDASESMLIPYGAQPGIDQQIDLLARQSGPMQAQQLFQSLLGRGGPTRIDRAREALISVIRSTPPDVDMGFISFHDCGDVRNFGYYGPGARGSLTSRVGATQVGRGTPLADSMMAAGTLIRGGRSPSDPAYMVIVTDGNDSCGGNPCAVAQQLARAYPGLQINVIDLSGTANLQCVANATGGRLVRPEGSAGLTDMVRRAAGQPDVPAHCLQ